MLHGINLTLEPGERLADRRPVRGGQVHPGPAAGRGARSRPAVRSRSAACRCTDLSPDRLRTQVALVSQEHHVFIGTVHDNVAMVRPGSSAADVRAALAAVNALDWAAALPQGLDDRGRRGRA